MNSGAMRITILWLHAIGGIAWVGAALVFVIAASAAAIDEEQGLAMVRRVAPAINRIGLGAMLFIVVSGVVNIYIAGMMRRFAFSNTFLVVLSAKIALLGAMYYLLIVSWRTLHELKSLDEEQAPAAARRLIMCNVAIAGCGGIALLLGLWLLGS
jgi:hypothetical protein